MIRTILIALFFLCAPCAIAQKPNPKIDSLERVLKTATDTNKVNTYMHLVRALASANPDKAIEYAKVAQKEAVIIQFPKGEAQALSALGVLNTYRGATKEAFVYQNQALKIYETIGDKNGVGIVLGNIGLIYMEKSNYPLALDYFQKALNIREAQKDAKGMLNCLGNIGAIYTLQANENPNSKDLYEKSRRNYTRALVIAKKINNKTAEADLLNNIGGTYDNEKDFEKALDYYTQSIDIHKKLNNKFRLAASYHVIGEIYRQKKIKDLPKAKEYQAKSLQIAEEIKDKNGIGQAKQGIASIHIDEQKYGEAIAELLPTLAIFKETGARDDLIKSKNLLATAYQAIGDYRSAFIQHTEGAALKDSVFNMQNIKHLSDLQSSFELERKDKELKLKAEEQKAKAEEQKAKDARQMLINIVLLGVVGILVFVYRSLRQTKKLNTQINKQVVLLKEQQEEINTQNEELLQSREEVMAQRDALSATNAELVEKNDIIAKEQEKSEALLLNILPEEVAEELKAEGKAKAKHYKLASVLFTDFQGFTARTATMTPEEVIEELNGCFSAFDAIIEKHGLEKIKTIGDAYMCAGGLPVPNTTNPADIIRAGLEIQTYMQQYKEACIARGEPYFQCRLGINTGEVVAGVVGTKKFAYDIWGDTVNTASRAESNGVVNMVNITEATYLLVKDVFKCEYRGEIEAKGKGKIKMYLVLGEA